MKRIIALLLLAFFVFCLPISAFAEQESNTDDVGIEPSSTRTSVSVELEHGDTSFVAAYTCQVRKSSVKIKFVSTNGQTQVYVRLKYKDSSTGNWLTNPGSVLLTPGETTTLYLDSPAIYRFQAKWMQGNTGFCNFQLTGY